MEESKGKPKNKKKEEDDEDDLFKYQKRNHKGEKIGINEDLKVTGKDSEEIESDEEEDDDDMYGDANEFEEEDDAAK